MQLFQNSLEIFKGDIFSFINPEQVYHRYLGFRPDLKSAFKSPFKEEKTPSFRFFVSSGQLFFKCFSTGNTGNVVNLVSLLFNCSYAEAIQMIANEYKLINTQPLLQNNYIKKESKIEVELFDTIPESFFKYWEQYEINKKILEYFNIKPAKYVWLNDKHILTYTPEKPIIRYLVNNKYKIYNPYNKDFKWLSTTKATDIFAINLIPKQGDFLVITKAMKDILCWSSIQIPAIAACSETCVISEDVINDLKNRYDKIIVFLDNDEAGVNAMKKYNDKYNLPCYMLPESSGEKDISDYIKTYGKENFQELLTTLKPILWQT